MKSSESSDSDEKKDKVPEIKSIEEIRREKAKGKKKAPVQNQEKSSMNPRLEAELRSITEQLAKRITIDENSQPSGNNKRTRNTHTTAAERRSEAFAVAVVPNKKLRVTNVDVSSTSSNLKQKGRGKISCDIEKAPTAVSRTAPTAVSRRAQAILAAERLRKMKGISYSLRSGGSKGLLDMDVDSIISKLKRKGKTDVNLEDMETDVEEGCKTTKRTRNNDDDKDTDGSGSGAAPEPRVTRSSRSRAIDPV